MDLVDGWRIIYDLTCDENSKSRLCRRHVAPQRANAESLSKSIKGKSRDAQVRAPSPSLASLILFLETWRTSFCRQKEEDQNNRNQLEMNIFTLYVFDEKLFTLPNWIGWFGKPSEVGLTLMCWFPLPGASCWPDARPPYTEDIRCKPSWFAMRGLQTWDGRQWRNWVCKPSQCQCQCVHFASVCHPSIWCRHGIIGVFMIHAWWNI